MASQSVLELAVNTGKWDSGLKEAKRALDNFTTAGGGLQQALGKDSDKMQQFVQMMGSMESRAKTAKGQMNDYKGTIEQLTMQYNRMTEAQQKTIGQEYLNSIEQLKKKYHDVSQEQQEMNRSLQNTSRTVEDSGSVLDTLTKRFTVNIDAIKLFNMGLQAAEGVLNVVKDAFFKNEQNLDEWGRTVKSCESLYSGFLVSLNTGDIGGYLSNIDDIVNAARAAYNALDDLSTFNAFNQVNRTKAQASFQDAVNAFLSDPSMQNRVMLNAKFSSYRENLATRQEIERAAYDAEIARVAAEHGISAKDLQDALSGSWGNYKSMKALKPSKKVTESNGFSGIYGGGAMLFGDSSSTRFVPANDAERLGEALRQLNDTELQYLQSLGAAANSTGIEITNIERKMLRVTRTGSSGNGGGGGGRESEAIAEVFPVGSIAALNKEMQELRKEQSLVTSSDEWTEYQRKIFGVKEEIKAIRGELTARDFGAISLMGLGTDKSAAAQENFRKQKLDVKIVQPKEKADVKANEILGGISNAVGNMVSGIEGLGIEIPKDMQNMLGALNSITMILTSIEAFQKVGAILGLFSNGGVVKAAGGYRVPGRTFSGDMVPARLNAGELVLNQAQAGIIANTLQDREFGGGIGIMQPYVDGEHILLGAENTLKRKGKGEIVTTSMLRQLGIM